MFPDQATAWRFHDWLTARRSQLDAADQARTFHRLQAERDERWTRMEKAEAEHDDHCTGNPCLVCGEVFPNQEGTGPWYPTPEVA